jgi:DNA-binding protein HU-beta
LYKKNAKIFDALKNIYNFATVFLLIKKKIMNKTVLIGAVAAKAALTKKETKKAVDAIIKTVEDVVGQGDKVVLLGFGTFTTVKKTSRKGVNPKTREPINIPAHTVVKFKPGTTFVKAIK